MPGAWNAVFDRDSLSSRICQKASFISIEVRFLALPNLLRMYEMFGNGYLLFTVFFVNVPAVYTETVFTVLFLTNTIGDLHGLFAGSVTSSSSIIFICLCIYRVRLHGIVI